MIFVKIALGLLGLGIVVFIHELGHFLAARLVGINVEAFSIGWGKPILKKKIGKVEYRLGMFPIGGYCKMSGEHDYDKVWEDRKNNILPEKWTFLGATPIRRIIVSFAGPFFNFIFAIIVMSVVWGIGFEEDVLENRIVLVSDYESKIIHPENNTDVQNKIYPADKAGLMSGDRIIEINGQKTANHHEVQKYIALNPENTLELKIERNGEEKILSVKPELDKNTGAGIIGVYFWTDPVIGNISPEGFAQTAGLNPNDRIIRVNEIPVYNTIDFNNTFRNFIASQELQNEHQEDIIISVPVCFEREGTELCTLIKFPYKTEEGLGFRWSSIKHINPSLSVGPALLKGMESSWETLVYSIKGISLLFSGVDPLKAVSGPVRITYLVGDIATEGFSESFGTGLRDMARFLAIISIALCIMNLLPLPILDGGLIILFIVEIIRRKPANPRAIRIFQTTGIVIICGLMLFALFGDIMYFTQ